jgi:hypothetical protein
MTESPKTESCVEICVVGAGPRGLSVLERLCARERARPSHGAVIVHLVDPRPPGAGQVWRTDQSRHLLMNTVASQVTVYTDDSVGIEGPIVPGPSLYEWARALAVADPVSGAASGTAAGTAAGTASGGAGARSDEPSDGPGPGVGDGFGIGVGVGVGGSGYDEEAVAEAQLLGPDDYPSRALYGRYLADSFAAITAAAPAHMKIHVHRSRAVALSDLHGVPGGPQGVRLEDGTRLHDLDAVVLAQGHVAARLSPLQERTAALARIHYLTYVTPSNPADVDLSGIAPGQNVLLRGLGLNFFDYMALFTLGRGGVFEPHPDDPLRLAYRASGREPKLFASSRRGVPYHARGENQKGPYGRYTPRLLTPERIAALRARHRDGERVRFTADVWPLICGEVESHYYGTLLRARGHGEDAERLTARYLTAAPGQERDALLEVYGIGADERWDWERLTDPVGGRTFADRAQFQEWLVGYLAADADAARAGNVEGPLKAALDVLRDLRNEIRQVVDHGGVDGDSHRDDLEGWYTPLNAFLSIGPPVRRILEMRALVEAGVLQLTGPGSLIRFDPADPSFVAQSSVVPGPPVRARALIEARLPDTDLRRTEDPLLRHLLNTEQAAPYRIATGGGPAYETGGLAVGERPYRLLDARGREHPRRFAYGVPTESVHWVTAAGIRPGVDSVTLGDSDAIAQAVLSLPVASQVPAAVRSRGLDAGLDADLTAALAPGLADVIV